MFILMVQEGLTLKKDIIILWRTTNLHNALLSWFLNVVIKYYNDTEISPNPHQRIPFGVLWSLICRPNLGNFLNTGALLSLAISDLIFS